MINNSVNIILLSIGCVGIVFWVRCQSVFTRILGSIITIILITWIIIFLTEVKIRKEMNGNLNINLGRPYIELCKELDALSTSDPLALKYVLSELKQNSYLIYQVWLASDSEKYSKFVNKLFETNSLKQSQH